jgi:hypothetical protein
VAQQPLGLLKMKILKQLPLKKMENIQRKLDEVIQASINTTYWISTDY